MSYDPEATFNKDIATLAKEILVQMIQSNKLTLKSGTDCYPDINKTNVEEVCKAYSTIYQTILKSKA